MTTVLPNEAVEWPDDVRPRVLRRMPFTAALAAGSVAGGKTMRISIVLGLALLVAACGGSSMPPAPSKAFERTVNGLCPSNPQQLKGTTPAGGACQDAPECAPACCSCSNGSPNNWLAVSCSNGKCDTAAAACFVTKDDAVLCV